MGSNGGRTAWALLAGTVLILTGTAACAAPLRDEGTASVDGEASPEAAEYAGYAAYAENEWGFVDLSIDASEGIPEDAEGVLADIRDRGVLRVAAAPYLSPQERIDGTRARQDRHAGADRELARRIAERMGVGAEIVPMGSGAALASLEDRTCDLAVSALSYSPERAARYALSRGYHYDHQDHQDDDGAGDDGAAADGAGTGLLIRTEDAGTIRSLADLSDRTVVVRSGSLEEALAAEEVAEYGELRRLPSSRDVYRALEDGWADAAVVDAEAGERYAMERPDLGMVPDLRLRPLPELDGDRIAARKGEFQLIAFVNGVIEEVLETGQYEAWYQELQERQERGAPEGTP